MIMTRMGDMLEVEWRRDEVSRVRFIGIRGLV